MQFHPNYTKSIPIFLIIVFALICYFSQNEKSVTVDEFSHLPSGIYNLLSMDLRMDRESPPLIKCLPAITSIITQPEMDPKLFKGEPNPWSLGYYFMYANQDRYQEIFRYGRCVIILIGCLLGWLVYRFGTELYGPNGGLFALFLYVFNPNIIAHSRLTTIDIGASCAIFLSIYCFWRYLKRRDLLSIIIAGLTLGIAQLSKFTALLLYPIFIIILTILTVKRSLYKKSDSGNFEKQSLIMDFGELIIIFFVSLLVINAGYLFSGTFKPIGDYHFLSEQLRKISSFLGETFPVPLPYDYMSGFDSQMAISSGNNPFYTTYLMGEHSQNGWPHYYIIAFLVKNPIAFILLQLMAIVIWIKSDDKRLENFLCVWMPVIVYVFYFSFFTHIPIGVRFLLPVFSLLFLAAGNLFKSKFLKNKTGEIIVSLLIIAYSIPAVSSYPNYLSYFNLIAGGSDNGHNWLIDSNLDWGQDLLSLKKYMERNGIENIKLGYFGRVDPIIYGINYELAKKDPEIGYHAISINYLVGRPFYLLDSGEKQLVYADLYYFNKYKSLKPMEIINDSIYLFDIKSKDLHQ